jgi:hypothetical protein
MLQTVNYLIKCYINEQLIHMQCSEAHEYNIHNNTIVNIANPEDALGIEDGAESENTLFSNVIIDSKTGSNITLGQNPAMPSPPPDSGNGNNGDNEGGGEESSDGDEGGDSDGGEDDSGGNDDEESEE